jgi:hypothetical protein
MAKRWGKDNTVITDDNTAITKDNKGKESKVNKSKVNKNIYAEFVSMSEEQHSKLIQEFGEDGANERIDRLNLYKGSTGKKYKDDYLTILNWERKNKQSQSKNQKQIDWEDI